MAHSYESDGDPWPNVSAPVNRAKQPKGPTEHELIKTLILALRNLSEAVQKSNMSIPISHVNIVAQALDQAYAAQTAYSNFLLDRDKF